MTRTLLLIFAFLVFVIGSFIFMVANHGRANGQLPYTTGATA